MRLRALLLALAIVLPFTQRVYALDDLDEWDFSTDSNGTLAANEDGSVTLGGANNPLPEQPRWNADTKLTTTALEAETAHYLWSYLTTDGAYYDKPQYLVAGEWVSLAEGGTKSATGYIEVLLAAGDLFGFRVLSTDSCCGIGFLTIAVGSPTPSPEPTPQPTPTQTPEAPSPSPSVAPTPTAEPPTTPEPPPTPEPSPEPTPEPSPEPTAPPPSVAPTQEPTNEPSPNPTATPQPTPEATVEPSVPPSPPPSPDPTAVPPPEPTQPPLPDLGEVAAAVEEVAAAAVEAVGESVAAIGGGIADIAAIGEIGKDLDATEKEEAAPMAVAVISSQIASVTAAAASAARGGSTPSGGNLGGGGGGGTDAPKTRKTSSRKELK